MAFSISARHFESDGYDMWRPDTTVPLANRDAIGTVKDNLSVKVMHEIDSACLLETGISCLKDEATGFYTPGAAGYTTQTREQFVPTFRFSHADDNPSTFLLLYGRFGKQWADTLNLIGDATNTDKINVGRVTTRGLELEALYRPLDNLTLSASYTFNDSEIIENASNPALVGKQLTNVPRRQGSMRADWSLAGGARLYAQVNHVGDRFGNDVNTTRYKHYTVLDLGGSYPIRKDIAFRLSWANVGDRQYDGVGYIAPGSVVTAGVDAKF